MLKRRLISMVLVLCLLFTTVAFCIGSVLGAVTTSGIEYNESRLHTMEDGVADAYIPGAYDQWIDSGNGGDSAGVDTPGAWWPEDYTETTDGFVTDSDANHGTVLKLNGSYNSHFGFEDFDVKKDRKYYIYFDAKSETAGAQGVTLIGVNNYSSSVKRIFFSGQSNRNTGVQFYVDGTKVNSQSFKYTKSWQRYGIVIDTSNEALLADIANVNGANFWSNDIHFQLGALDATVYFDNIQLIEIQALPDAVADEKSVSAAVSVRLPKTKAENNGLYVAAGLRFMGTINDDVKANAEEIGFVLTPSAHAVNNKDWYDVSNGVKTNVRTAVCYIKDESDVVYSKGPGYTAYQVILSGLSKPDGRTSYIQRYSAAMYVKSASGYTYYSLGETSFNEVTAKYYMMGIKSGHINTGVELVVNGQAHKSSLTVGDELPVLSDYMSDEPAKHKFLGWYDSTLTTPYTTVPNGVDKLYAKYEGYTEYSFETGAIYDPNNKGNITAVTDPFDGNGTVMYSPVINKNDSITKGFHRGIVPSIIDGISSKGFAFEKDHTYDVSFYYRYAVSDPSDASTSLDVYATDPAGVYNNGSKSGLSPKFTVGSNKLTNKGDWTLCRFTVTNTTDYKHLFLRFMGGSTDVIYNFYIDNLVIIDTTVIDDGSVKLVNGGIVESTNLTAGSALPVLNNIYDDVVGRTHNFEGWYDKTLTTKYTTVSASVNTYYAKFTNYTAYSFEHGGMYDPNNRYALTNKKSTAVWYRVPDPTGATNICMRANLSGNSNNTHFAPSLFEGSDDGYKLQSNRKYIIRFDYYVSTTSNIEASISFRGSAQSNIGTTGGKTEPMGSVVIPMLNTWDHASIVFTTESDVEALPYLIILSQGNSAILDLTVYLDNLVIAEYSADDDIIIKTPVDNINYNNNGVITHYDNSYVGAELDVPVEYAGATFEGWYNETLTVPYSTVPGRKIMLYARYDSTIINFENGGYFNPNNNFGTGISPYALTADPTNSNNTVIKVNLANNTNNTHFALSESGYSNEDGYKLTIGNSYTITFKYYAQNLNSSGVSVQFRGCKQANIGLNGGKSNAYGGVKLNVEKKWTTVSTSFTYTGTNLTDVTHPYLLLLAQDGAATGSSACTATVYLDDIVIKETVAPKTYLKKDVKAGGWTIGYANRPHNIVVPDANFSYVAMMQCEALADVLKQSTTSSMTFNIVRDSKWTQLDNQFNIFIGDVRGHSKDNASSKVNTSSFGYDDYAISIGNGNVYIDGGSPYALAMGISEFSKMYQSAASGTNLTGVHYGKYSEKIGSYPTDSYYRPTFLEDFDGSEINTDIWKVVDGSNIEARGYYDENGVYHSQADNNWQSVRSAEHTYLEDGKLVIEAAYSKDKQLFYGGMLRSHSRMEYRYGYLEVSCITPHGEGLWTATWATPNGAGEGLFRNEVDVNECFGNARYTAFNMHTWPTTAGSNLGYGHYSLDSRGYDAKKFDSGKTAGLNDGFHTFGYLWTEDKGVFTADGMVQFEYNFDKSSSYYKNDIDAFSDKMSLIFSMTVGNPSSGADPILGADYWTTSNKYIADYIHIYQIDGQEIYFTPPVE